LAFAIDEICFKKLRLSANLCHSVAYAFGFEVHNGRRTIQLQLCSISWLSPLTTHSSLEDMKFEHTCRAVQVVW